MSPPSPSHEAKTLVRRIYTHLDQRDFEGVLDLCAPDFVWCESDGSPMGGVHTSPDKVRAAVFAPMNRLFDDYRITCERLIGEEPQVCAMVTIRGRCAETQEPFTIPGIHVWTLVDGQAARFHQCTDTYRLRQALGQVPDEIPAGAPPSTKLG